MRALVVAAALAACHAAPAAAPAPMPDLDPAALRARFDEAQDRPRLIVALSPT
jgi:hypothetical protein